MIIHDPIGDMIIRIKNAGLAGRQTVELPHSNTKETIAKILVSEGYIAKTENVEKEGKKNLFLTLKYLDKEHVIRDVHRRSKPGLRVYIGAHEIPIVVGGLGIAIISTPQGTMTGNEAKKRKIGGELLCEIW